MSGARHELTDEERRRGAANSTRNSKKSAEWLSANGRKAARARWAASPSNASPVAILYGPPSSPPSPQSIPPVGPDIPGDGSRSSVSIRDERQALIRDDRSQAQDENQPDQRLLLIERGQKAVAERARGPWRGPKLGHLKGEEIRKRKNKFYRCPSGCYPARLASLYDELPWAFFVTLTARQDEPDDMLFRYLADWEPGFDKLGDSRYPETRPFWLMALSNHNVTWRPGSIDPFKAGNPHAHILLGNISMDALWYSLSSWPGGCEISKDKDGVARVWNRWGALHYLFSQEKLPDRHAQDTNSYCNVLLRAPSESPNLRVFEQEVYRRRLSRLKTITPTDRWLAGERRVVQRRPRDRRR